MALAAGSPVTLDIERAVAGGRMLARHEGQIVFVSGAVPGERVLAVVERVARGTVFAVTRDVLVPSPDRRAGVTGGCGGAVYGHIAYARQVGLKASVIEDAWRRVARLALPGPLTVTPSPERGYRSRARLHAVGTRLGFYREGTHQLCDPVETGQLSDATVAWVRSDRGAARVPRPPRTGGPRDGRGRRGTRARLPPVDGGRGRPAWARRAGDSPDRVSADGGCAARRAQAGRRRDLSPGGGAVLAGDPAVVDRVTVAGAGPAHRSTWRCATTCDRSSRATASCSSRSCSTCSTPRSTGRRSISTRAPDSSASPLAAALRIPVVLVEGDSWSSRDLAHNATPFADLARVEQESVERFVSDPCGGCRTWIVDPPRTGLSDAVRAAIGRDQPERVVYVSCDAATLARDVRALTDRGYEASALTGFDLFPSTAHVEAVCVLDRQVEQAMGHRLWLPLVAGTQFRVYPLTG